MRKGRNFQREQVYVCGGFLDGDIYPVFQPAGKRRKKCRPTSAVQKKLNQKNAERKLTRLVHMNFTERDLALHLTYDAEHSPEDAAEALRTVQNYLKALKRRYRKLGLELKYILSTEYGGRGGRVHHHLILSGGVDRDELEALWGRGYANSRRLQFGPSGVTGLAHYISKGGAAYKRWSGSRNLVKPESATFDGQLTAKEVKELAEDAEQGSAWRWFEERYQEFELVRCEVYRNGINQGNYIHFEMRRRNGKGFAPRCAGL